MIGQNKKCQKRFRFKERLHFIPYIMLNTLNKQIKYPLPTNLRVETRKYKMLEAIFNQSIIN